MSKLKNKFIYIILLIIMIVIIKLASGNIFVLKIFKYKDLGNVQYIGWYSEGYVKYQTNNKYGFLDVNGNIKIIPKYDYVIDFIDGESIVTLGGKSGVINKSEDFIIKPQYDSIEIKKEGYRIVRRDNRCGYIDSKGRQLTEIVYYRCKDYENKYAIIQNGPDVYSKCNYLNQDGKLISKQYYNRCKVFSEGLATVFVGKLTSNYKIMRCGYLNTNGEIEIPIIYGGCSNFRYGKAAVSLNSKFGYINKNNSWVIKPNYANAEAYSDNVAWVQDLDNKKYGLINENGQYLLEPSFDIPHYFNYSVLSAIINKQNQVKECSYVDTTGKILKTFMNIDDCEPFWENQSPFTYVDFAKPNGFIIINKKIEIIYSSKEHDQSGFLGFNFMSDERFGIKKNGLWGYINENGKVIIGNKYEYAKSFNEGYAFVGINEDGIIINKNGSVRFMFKYIGEKK